MPVQSIEQRQAVFVDGKATGGKAGAMYIHDNLHPYYWGVSKPQLRQFIDDVKAAVADGTIKNRGRHPYKQDKFDNHSVGPNMYQVNDQFIKPRTDKGSLIPYISYSLLLNNTEGCECHIFISHAWSEGAFEFGLSILQLDIWPEDHTCGAYICFLSNPQNLDISHLLDHPKTSPFRKVIEQRPWMIMVANSNTPIHTRLWCCYEAYCAATVGHVMVEIVGNPLHLLHEGSERDKALENLTEEARRDDEFSAQMEFIESVTLPPKVTLQKAKTRKELQLQNHVIAELQFRRLEFRRDSFIRHLEIDITKGDCRDDKDYRLIMEEMMRDEYLKKRTNENLKELMHRAFNHKGALGF